MKNNTNSPPENQKKPNNNWLIAFFAIAGVVLIISYAINVIVPKTVPIQENSWGEITPGYSTTDQVIKKLGQPKKVVQTPQGTELSFESSFPAIPNKVIADRAGKIVFIKEFLLYDENHLLEQYVEKYGQPGLVLNDLEGGSLKAHVFLKQGLVIMAHIADNSVQEKWYFPPTTQDIFLKSWGSGLSTEEHGPEESYL